MIDYKGLLSRAIYEYEAKLGAFLSSGKEISDLREKARAYYSTSNNLVKQQAAAVAAKADGLLGDFRSIQEQALATAQAAAALRGKMDSDPVWKNVLSASPLSWGYETAKQAALMFGQATRLAADLALITKRISTHGKNVSALQADVSGLDNFAQGKGIKATVGSLAGWGGSTVKTVATVAAVAAVAAYLLPAGIARAARRA